MNSADVTVHAYTCVEKVLIICTQYNYKGVPTVRIQHDLHHNTDRHVDMIYAAENKLDKIPFFRISVPKLKSRRLQSVFRL